MKARHLGLAAVGGIGVAVWVFPVESWTDAVALNVPRNAGSGGTHSGNVTSLQ